MFSNQWGNYLLSTKLYTKSCLGMFSSSRDIFMHRFSHYIDKVKRLTFSVPMRTFSNNHTRNFGNFFYYDGHFMLPITSNKKYVFFMQSVKTPLPYKIKNRNFLYQFLDSKNNGRIVRNYTNTCSVTLFA